MTNDDVSVFLGNQQITGWTRIRITRGIERMPADFEIELTEYYPGDVNAVSIIAGSPIQICFGSDLVLTGYVDIYDQTIDSSNHTITISGRSMSEDLVDCSAEWPNGQFLSAPVIDIIKGICSPYKINVGVNTIKTYSMPVLPNFLFMYGETGVELIERICRFAKLLFYDLPDGSILLTTASSYKTPSGFQEGINVQAASYRTTMQRFSEYDCVYNPVVQFTDGTQANTGANNTINEYSSVLDTSVPFGRHRKKYIITVSGDYDNQSVTKDTALWEANRRYGKSWELILKTDGWRDSSQNLWAPNTLVNVNIPSLKIVNQDMMIAEVTYLRDENSGTTAEIKLNPPIAFVPEPIVFLNNPYREHPTDQGGVSYPQNTGGPKQPVPMPPSADQLASTPLPTNTKIPPINSSFLNPPQ